MLLRPFDIGIRKQFQLPRKTTAPFIYYTVSTTNNKEQPHTTTQQHQQPISNQQTQTLAKMDRCTHTARTMFDLREKKRKKYWEGRRECRVGATTLLPLPLGEEEAKQEQKTDRQQEGVGLTPLHK